MPTRRAVVALVAVASFVLASLGFAEPATADVPARLTYANLTTLALGSQTLVQLKLRTAGDVVRLDYEYDVTTGTIPTIRFTRSLPVAAGETAQSDVLFAFAPSGSYTLTVTVVGADGSTTRYLPDGRATTCTVTRACGATVSGLDVLSGTSFVRAGGPASLAQMIAAAAHLTTASLTTPAPNAHIASGATVATSIGYAGANSFSPPTGTSMFPIYQGDSYSAYFPGPSVTAVASTGTAVSSGAGPTAGYYWKPYYYVLRTGLVDRVATDSDRAWIHTVWPLAATSLATMPVACGIEASFSPPADCVLGETVAVPVTADNGFLVDGVRTYSGPWAASAISGGSTSTNIVVSNSTHPISFVVHYRGLTSPQSESQSVSVTGPGSDTLLTNSSVGPSCPYDAASTFYECDITITVYNVHYNGTYRATSVSISTAETPTVVCKPGPTATLVGYHLLDTTSAASRAAQLCGGISWSSLTATVSGLAAPPCTDSSPPVLTSFARTSATAFNATNSPTTGAATFRWAATDAGCGLTQVKATFVRPDGLSWVAATTVSARASGTGTVTLTPQPGSWGLQRVTVVDAAGNVRHYDSNGVASGVLGGPDRPWQRSPHSFDLATAGVRATAGAPPRGVPAPPRSLAAASLGTSLALTWLAPSPATGVTRYTATIRSRLDATIRTVSTTATHATFAGLDSSTPYEVWVEAMAGTVVSAWTPLYGAVTPKPAPLLVAPAAAPTLGALPTVTRSTAVPLSVARRVVPGYPVSGYVLQWSHAGPSQVMSAWSDRVTTHPAPPTAVTRLALGTRLCVRLFALNSVGRGPVSATRCTAVPLDDRGLTRSTGWSIPRTAGAFAGTLTTSTRRGATLTFVARGHGLVLLVRTARGAGTLGVYVGSRRVASLSLASSRTRLTSLTLSSRVTGAMTGQRITLRVETSGRTVAVDGVAVLT